MFICFSLCIFVWEVMLIINKGIFFFIFFEGNLKIFLLCFIMENNFIFLGWELMFIINICVVELSIGCVVLLSGVEIVVDVWCLVVRNII